LRIQDAASIFPVLPLSWERKELIGLARELQICYPNRDWSILSFAPMREHEPGTIAFILEKSWAALLSVDPQYREPEENSWGELNDRKDQ
jgi:hypothetical protein